MSEYDDDFGTVPGILEGGATISYVDESGLPDSIAEEAFRRTDIAGAIERWSRNVQSQSNAGSLFFRNRYDLTDNIFDQMMQCADAVEYDDVLSSISDVVEGMAFARMNFETADNDDEDVWNQLYADLDMDTKLREMWRELYKCSQVYVGLWWEKKVYTVRTKPAELHAATLPDSLAAPDPANPDAPPPTVTLPPKQKRKRRKQYAINVPTAVTIFDPTKIMPVGNLMFGRERFAYIATRGEAEAFMRTLQGETQDATFSRLIEGPYNPTDEEKAILGVGSKDSFWLLRPEACFRHTLTKADYERFSSVRLKSVLPLLDMKAHLRASDRATLIGATNFIVVLKRGTDKNPARPAEIAQLQEQARVVARLPILVGPHDLSVEIVTPLLDHTLEVGRYQVLDSAIARRALQSFQPTTTRGTSNDTSLQVAAVERGIESRRFQLARSIERHIIKRCMDMNPGTFKEMPELTFSPKRVSIELNENVINAVLKLRDRGDLSRQTVLEEFDYSQDVEFLRRQREEEIYDSIFSSAVPFSSPGNNPFTPTATDQGRPPTGGTTPAKKAPTKAAPRPAAD